MGAEILKRAATATMIEETEGMLILRLRKGFRQMQSSVVRDCLSVMLQY
jgi:hypothetical protein